MYHHWKKSSAPSGDYNPFFYCSFIEAMGYNEKILYDCSFCHDIISNSSIYVDGHWVICLYNLFQEDNHERIEKFKNILKKVNITMPIFVINTQGNIEIYCDKKEFNSKMIKLFLLKLLRFSYLSFGETIGQLFLNQRFYQYSISDDYFYSHSDSEILKQHPNNWVEIFNKVNSQNSHLLNYNLNEQYNRNEFCRSIWNLKEQSLQFQEVRSPGLRVQLHASGKGF